MREIRLQVADDKFYMVLSLLSSLKHGIIENLTIDEKTKDNELHLYKQTPQFQKDKEEVLRCLEDYEKGEARLLTQKEYNVQMDNFLKELKTKYANS